MDGGQVIGPVGIRDHLKELALFGDLFEAPVQVADIGLSVENLLAVEAGEDAEHAVGAGMLRPHIDEELFGTDPDALVRGNDLLHDLVHLLIAFSTAPVATVRLLGDALRGGLSST